MPNLDAGIPSISQSADCTKRTYDLSEIMLLKVHYRKEKIMLLIKSNLLKSALV